MIKRYDCTNGGYQYCAGCFQMSVDEYGDYLRVDDVESRLESIWATPIYNPENVREAIEKLIEESKWTAHTP